MGIAGTLGTNVFHQRTHPGPIDIIMTIVTAEMIIAIAVAISSIFALVTATMMTTVDTSPAAVLVALVACTPVLPENV
jgi:hypothetical protein